MQTGTVVKDRTARAVSRGNRWLILVLLLGVSFVCTAPACTKFSRYSNRRDTLKQELKRFHLALFMKDTPSLLRQIPSEERPDWAEAFPCFFQRYRVVDYRIQEVKTGPKVADARVIVWLTRHPNDSLATEETVWIEQWEYRNKRWFLDTESEKTRKYLGDCLPPGGEKQEPDDPGGSTEPDARDGSAEDEAEG